MEILDQALNDNSVEVRPFQFKKTKSLLVSYTWLYLIKQLDGLALFVALHSCLNCPCTTSLPARSLLY